MKEKLYLILENGAIFEGESFGAAGVAIGEVVFNTGMVGYLEMLTDPCCFGQIVVSTFPLIGNYGVIHDDFVSDKPFLNAYIVKDWCQDPSNFRSEGSLDTFLKERNIVGMCGVDTRALTKILRDNGTMNGIITADKNVGLEKVKAFRIENAVKSVASASSTVLGDDGADIVFVDFGSENGIKSDLVRMGFKVHTVPASTTASEILAMNPVGVVLSDGPGDPAENVEIIGEIKALCAENMPIFAIGLGHQMLALSQGAKTFKLKYGHRGASAPVSHEGGRIFITTQNHGYAVCADSLPSGAHVSFKNVNDQTCEGIEYENMPAFSVQFKPMLDAGPHDTAFLFEKFMQNVKEGAKNAAQ